MTSKSSSQMNQVTDAENTDSRWKGVYKVGGAAALIMVLLVLLDIIVSILLPGGNIRPGTRTAIDWFTLFQGNLLLGLRDLGFLNIINSVLGIPVFLALYAAHQRVNREYAALAAILFLFGGAVYISNNTVLPMFVLSGKYAAATTDAQRAIFLAAGETMLARGADFTLGSLIGFLLPLIASIAMSFVMLRGRIFSKAAAYTGILGYIFLLIFTVWTTFVPALFDVAMMIAIPGGLLVMTWNILIARRLFQLGQGVSKEEANRN